MSYVYCPKCKSKNISKTETGYVCNECGNEFPEYQPTTIEVFSDECKDKFGGFLSYVKSINASDYKEKLFNVKMVRRYISVAVLVAVVIGAYNTGKSVAIEETWLMRKADYQTTVDEQAKAENKLMKLEKEIASNSDMIADMRLFEQKRVDKWAQIDSLREQIADLNSDKEDLERDITNLSNEVTELTKEKEKLTGEIAAAKGKGYTLTAGLYVGGDDIPTGTYNINWISGSGNVFVGRQVNEIFGNNSRYGYIKTYKNCDVSYGTEIQIKGNLKVQFKAKD